MFKKFSLAAAAASVFMFGVISVASADSVDFSPVSLSSAASGDNWNTTYGFVKFQTEQDYLVVALNGEEIFSVHPDWQILGEVPFLNLNRSFSFDINTSVNPHDISIYAVIAGVRTQVK